MNGGKKLAAFICLLLSVSILSTSLSALFLAGHYSNVQFQLLGGFCQSLIMKQGVGKDFLMEAVRDYKDHGTQEDYENLLEDYGYRASDFSGQSGKLGRLVPALFIGIGFALFLFTLFYWRYKADKQLQAITEYLEKANLGEQGLLLPTGEGSLFRLQDEIYKTVTALYQTRGAALEAKHNYAENLSNIAHQLKTPITAISLSAQMIEEACASNYAGQIKRQVARLMHLEEALLLLSRIDAGTLTLETAKIDVFTLLTLAADNLQELSAHSQIAVDIPEMDQAAFDGDMEWTMEAIMNLFKNCMEHSPAGSTIHCSYAQNPLYVQILIWDEGRGFEKEDILHLFKRFYRGKHAAKGGIGIGLSLSKAIIEMQNGIIRAGNLPNGGAFFEIHMYSH